MAIVRATVTVTAPAAALAAAPAAAVVLALVVVVAPVVVVALGVAPGVHHPPHDEAEMSQAGRDQRMSGPLDGSLRPGTPQEDS